MTTPEVVASLRAVFGPLCDAPEVAAAMRALPTEGLLTAESGFDNRIADVEALGRVAEALAPRVVQQLGCGDTPACYAEVTDRLARRLFRRPLTVAERSSFITFMQETGTAWGIVRAIVSPHFHQHLELQSTAEATRLRIDAFAVASRLAFAVIGALPDEPLLEAAERGELETFEQVRTHAERLAQTPAARAKLHRLFARWAAPAGIDPHPAVAEQLGIVAEGFSAEADAELDRFIDDALFTRKADARALIAGEQSFVETPRLSRVMGTAEPRGLFLRPASLVTSRPETSPIIRGAILRRRALCEIFPTPDPTLVAQGLAVQETLSPREFSGRHRAAVATGGAACAGCHGRINAAGFALENLGPAGELRHEQVVFDESGARVAAFPVDARVDDVFIASAGSVNGAFALARAIADSPAAHSCLAQQLFIEAHYRFPSLDDACVMEEVAQASRTGTPVVSVWLASIVNDDLFHRAELSP